MSQTRKQKLKSLMKKYKRTLKHRGGKKDKDGKLKMFDGIMEAVKLLIANKIAILVNWQVTSRLNKRMLHGLPRMQKEALEYKINNVAHQMSSDMAVKGLDTGENIIRALPAFGNLVSLISAGDKAMAGMKNAREALYDIKDEIEEVKVSLMAAGFDPAKDFPFLDSIPPIPQIPLLDQIEDVFDYANADVEQDDNPADKKRRENKGAAGLPPKGGGLIKEKIESHPAVYKKVITRTKDSINSFHN